MTDITKTQFFQNLKEFAEYKFKTHYAIADALDIFLDTLFLSLTLQLEELQDLKKRLKKEELSLLQKTIASFGEEAEKHPYTDLLGDFVLEQKSLKDKQYKGQFFTPSNVSDFMAKVTLNLEKTEEKDIIEKMSRGETFRIAEPSSGSGRMILSCAKVLRKQFPNIPLHKYLEVVAIDIDPLCIKMTAINTAIWGIPTILIRGNALTEITPDTHQIFYNLPYYSLAEHVFSRRKLVQSINEINRLVREGSDPEKVVSEKKKIVKQMALF